MIKILIRRTSNGYILKFYRGFWDIFVCRSVAMSKGQILNLIDEQLNKSFIDFGQESEV